MIMLLLLLGPAVCWSFWIAWDFHLALRSARLHTLYLLSGNSMQHLINILEWGAIRIFADLLYEAIRGLINIGLILGWKLDRVSRQKRGMLSLVVMFQTWLEPSIIRSQINPIFYYNFSCSYPIFKISFCGETQWSIAFKSHLLTS